VWENINALYECNIISSIIESWLIDVFDNLYYKKQKYLFYFAMDKDIPVYIHILKKIGLNVHSNNDLVLNNKKWLYHRCRKLLL
jgi:hypothetical protein